MEQWAVDTDLLRDLDGNELPCARTNNAVLSAMVEFVAPGSHSVGKKILRYYPHNLNNPKEYHRKLNFKILMSWARTLDIKYISLSKREIIASKIPITGSKVFSDLFAWQIKEKFGFPGACGNGMGHTSAQSQHDATKYFGAHCSGIWNPQTESLFTDKVFDLYTSRDIIDQFHWAIVDGTISEFLKHKTW